MNAVNKHKTTIALLVLASFVLSACTTTRYLAPVESAGIMRRGAIHVVLTDGSELRLKSCRLEADKLIGFHAGGAREEIELSRIRAVYVRKLKPAVPIIAALSAGAALVTIWLETSAADAPSRSP